MNDLFILAGKLLKFSIVGFSGLLIDFGVTYLCKEKLHINKYVANIAGFSCAVVTNFFLNKFWTFNDSNPNVEYQLLQFVGVSFIGLLINQGLLYLFHKYGKREFYVAKLIAIVLTVAWNFTVNLLITFQ